MAKENERTIVIPLAEAGGGKGTLLKKVFNAHGYYPMHLPMSSIIRERLPHDASLATELERSKQGFLVSDSHAVPLMLTAIDRVASESFLYFDGVPRTMLQLYAMRERMASNGFAGARVIVIHLNTAQVTCGYRLAFRAIQENRTDDKDMSIILRRGEEFRRHTQPVVDHLAACAESAYGWKFYRFDGNDILGTADTLHQVLHLPEHHKQQPPSAST